MALSRSSQEMMNSSIGENSFFMGRFHINGSLRVNGRFEGKALQADQLYVGVTGKIKTDVKAVSVIVEGMIIGNIEASSRIMLLPTARILGNIKTPELIIQNGVVLEGEVTISADPHSSAKDMIEKQFGEDFVPQVSLFSDYYDSQRQRRS